MEFLGAIVEFLWKCTLFELAMRACIPAVFIICIHTIAIAILHFVQRSKPKRVFKVARMMLDVYTTAVKLNLHRLHTLSIIVRLNNQ